MNTAVQTPTEGRWNSQQVALAVGISYLGMAATFLSNIALARLLGVSGKGVFSLFLVTVGGIVAFSGLGIGHGQMFHATRDPQKLRHFMPNAYIVAGLMCGGIATAYVLVALSLNLSVVTKLGWPVVAAALVVVPVVSLSVFQRQYFLTRHQYRLSKTVIALSQILPLVAYIGLFVAGRVTLANAVIAFVITQVVCCVIAEVFIKRTQPLGTGVSLSFGKDSLRFGILQYLSGIVEFLMGRLDFFLVAWLLGRAGLGIYSVAVAMAETTTRLPSEFGTVLFPAFAAGRLDTSRTATILRKTLLLALVIAIALVILSGPMTIFLFGNQFRSAIPAFRVLLLGTVAWSTIYVTWNRTSARGRPAVGILIFGSAAAFDALANLFLLPHFGVAGGAIAATGSYLLAAFLFLRVFCRNERCSYREALIIRRSDLLEILELLIHLAAAAVKRVVQDVRRSEPPLR